MKKVLLSFTLILCMLVGCAVSNDNSSSFENFPSSGEDRTWEEVQAPAENPYLSMSSEDFYTDYAPATSYKDALFRSEVGFLSGDIEVPDQEPQKAAYMPKNGRKYVRNTTDLYSDDGNTYYVLDGNGYIVNRIFRGGGYISLEEVAAYVYAFGQIPANYVKSKKTKPSESIWGEHLRLNFSKFSGSATKYPYEPRLPNITGNGGSVQYYEIDVGTTGTDAGEGYDVRIYNNGTSITRGAARIVFSVEDDYQFIDDADERYVFYTYNHYNDFQEYLNYQGGWGEMFGNITGGGTLSSKDDCNPTDYEETFNKDLRSSTLLSALNEFLGNPNYCQTA